MSADTERSAAYVWLDTEYTDLDLDRARLLQVAAIVTDADLRRVLPAERDVNLCVRLAPETAVSAWAEQHLAGVLAVCRSPQAVDAAEADRRLEACLRDAMGPAAAEMSRRPVLCGNSVHADWYLARRFLPGFVRCLHYRHLDVTAWKLQWQDWFRGPPFDKEDLALVHRSFPGDASTLDGARHDAYFDVHASIAELNYYRAGLARTS